MADELEDRVRELEAQVAEQSRKLLAFDEELQGANDVVARTLVQIKSAPTAHQGDVAALRRLVEKLVAAEADVEFLDAVRHNMEQGS